MTSSKSNNDIFIALYNDLDEAIREKYKLEDHGYSAINFYIARLRKTPGVVAERFTESLDAIRQLRNSLVHSSRLDNEEMFSVSPKVIDELKAILNYVKNPPKLLSKAVPFKDLLKAYLEDNPSLEDLSKEMLRRGISHVPVLKGEELYGVYSEATLFAFMSQHSELPLSELHLQDLEGYLEIEAHHNERYIFVPRNYPLEEGYLEFASSKEKTGQRLGLIFISEHGRVYEKILGVVSLGGLR